MKKQIYQWIFFKIMGWKMVGNFDNTIKKCVFIVMPHTSWHDFFIGLFTRGVMNEEVNWVGKKELFRFPFGFYFRYMGGAPLDRSGGLNKVETIASLFSKREVFRLALAPEGTRKKVKELRTGFYYIALTANVPIIAVALDFSKKIVSLGQPLQPSGDIASDLAILKKHYIGVEGKFPEQGFQIK
ncbi:1-acyl-sn-glycerol-3-phosphate acyltransferase [Flavobacterium sp. N3904]|uniref:1-acyl-sn-glycerol-3-phosphate acyltransferase n=1 Tax=Flavobacterium sp. N3904 TaxID=2986835 RepID=UPI002224157C|nr:1-acyl-sn-glycerol-3-phosphate acyltransferase [Flavobacterium sp. N3904]